MESHLHIQRSYQHKKEQFASSIDYHINHESSLIKISSEDQAINQITILQIVNTSTTPQNQEMKGKLTKRLRTGIRLLTDLLASFQLNNLQLRRQINLSGSSRLFLHLARKIHLHLLHRLAEPEARIHAVILEMDSLQSLDVKPMQERVRIDNESKESQ